MWTELRTRLASDILTAGFDYWSSLTSSEEVPRRCLFDPSELPPELLPNTVMLEVSDAPLDFRYRVVGDQILRFMAENPTGLWLSQIAHQAPPSPLFKTLKTAVQGPAPVVSDSPFADPDQALYPCQEIVLPLRGENGRISRLLTFIEVDCTEPDLKSAIG